MTSVFDDKAAAREAVWDRLQAEKLARFPFPPHGRIPNFAGAREAARRLFQLDVFEKARALKVNPDAPQRFVRVEALARGIRVLMPTPRLRAGFLCLDPERIPVGRLREAASLSKCRRWAEEVPLRRLPQLDAIVCGSVAVTRDGARCGKGEGYSDLEYAILRELGQPPLPVATTVHPVQIVAGFPREPNDLPLDWVATPDGIFEVPGSRSAPDGIDWDLLDEARLDEMPVLRELWAERSR